MSIPPLHRILYAEDEQSMREIVRYTLERNAPYQLRLCSSGEEAVNVADDFQPDMILLDVMMPGMDGPEALKRLRQKDCCKDIPIVFLTAVDNAEQMEEFIELGATDIILKPIDPSTLAEHTREIWEEFHEK